MTATLATRSIRSATCATTTGSPLPACAGAGLTMPSITTSCASTGLGRSETEDLSSPSMKPETQLSSISVLRGRERFEALSRRAKDAILDEHRSYNIEDGLGWWDGVYENFISDMKEIGIEVATHPVRTTRGTYEQRSIYFSGFWSQGDGACFEGHVDDWTTFIKVAFPNDVEEYMPLWTEAEAGSPSLSWTHSGRYYHENSCTFHSEYDIENGFDQDTQPLRYVVRRAIVEYAEILVEKMFEEAEEFVKGKMQELYKALEEEHDYLTSDDAVLGAIEDQLDEIIDELEGEDNE